MEPVVSCSITEVHNKTVDGELLGTLVKLEMGQIARMFVLFYYFCQYFDLGAAHR